MRVGEVEYAVLGGGDPVTVLAHGLAGGPHETRPLAAQLEGTRVLLTFRGHGASGSLRSDWGYDDLAADLLLVADAVGATRAVGLSVGAGALLHLLASDPGRFDAFVLALPASLDRARTDAGTRRLELIGEAVAAGDAVEVLTAVLAELPLELRDTRAARVIAARRARELMERVPPSPAADARPVADPAKLAAVRAPALVLAQEDDPLHPVTVAEQVAAALPCSRLVVLPPAGLAWTARDRVAAELRAHLGRVPASCP